MDNEHTLTLDFATAADSVVIPRDEYDLLRDAVTTLKNVRTILLANTMQDFSKLESAYAILFPEKVIPLEGGKEDA